jgi:peroxiredoxin
MKSKTLLNALTAGLFTVALVGVAPAFAQHASQPAAPATQPAVQPSGKDKEHHEGKQKKDGEHKKDAAQTKGDAAQVGQPAPAFKLTGIDGKEVSLADFKGKVVVLEWFNPSCPFILKHHKINSTFNDLHKKYEGKDVVMLAINSGKEGNQGSGKEVNEKAAKEFKIAYPILLDAKGDVGKAYGAKTTPHCFVIDKNGVLAYSGAIDDDKSPETPGKTNYVAKAVDELLAGSSVSTSTTKPYGCAVKY